MARSHIACVTFTGFGSFVCLAASLSVSDTVASAPSGSKFLGRAQASGLRPFGTCATASPSPASFPPNKSFKPTPCLGFVETCRHAGNTGSHPPRSARLNSGVRRQKNIRFQPRLACSAASLIFAPSPSLAAALALFSNHAMLRIVRLARSRFASVTFSRFGNCGWCGLCSATDTVASETPG